MLFLESLWFKLIIKYLSTLVGSSEIDDCLVFVADDTESIKLFISSSLSILTISRSSFFSFITSVTLIFSKSYDFGNSIFFLLQAVNHIKSKINIEYFFNFFIYYLLLESPVL